MPYDAHNPLTVSLPFNFTSEKEYPTEVMAGRFQAWRSIIKELVNYLREYANVQQEIVRQQLRLQQASTTLNATTNSVTRGTSTNSNNAAAAAKEEANAVIKYFLPVGNGSVRDIPGVFTKYHQQNVTNSTKTLKDINNIIIPKLEELRKDLLLKIKEIKNLQNDFKTNLGKELQETKNLLAMYHQAIENSNKLDTRSHSNSASDQGDIARYDPYLVKTRLDRQLRRQMQEEGSLHDAYSNLQSAGGKLESIVVLEIQNYLSMFLNLINIESSSLTTFLVPKISDGFLSKETSFEWEAFISRNLPSSNLGVSPVSNNTSVSIKNGTFIDMSVPRRRMGDLIIPDFDSNLNLAVRSGFLERRSKYLKNYSTAWFVLTCNYIHEFKSSDRKKDPMPSISLSLDSCSVSEHSKDDGRTSGVYKFILVSKSSNGLINRTHNWVFRTDTYANMIAWFDDIKKLTNLPTPAARARTITTAHPPVRSATNSPGVSRSVSRITNEGAKSINSLTSGESRRYPRQRPLSQATSIANANRLSSTFSQKNNISPRLPNMINSDGTIITPVDSFVVSQKRHSDSYSPDRTHEFEQHEQQNSGYQVVTNDVQHQVHPAQAPQSNRYSTPPAGYQYYVPANPLQPQQYYDPVQQQYFTITPSVIPAGQAPAITPSTSKQSQHQQQQSQQPQPQYFPVSPSLATAGTPPLFVNAPASPSMLHTGYFVPSQIQTGAAAAAAADKLPYPSNNDPPEVESGEKDGERDGEGEGRDETSTIRQAGTTPDKDN
ncbi:Phosphatidylinositol 45-bisphosphate-binding protein SLM1 [Spathaspora sp. JA1]|nr:Phosphatidylinositol 45-bisphosphate-binding protein SLM1 [Spathaspora sp. JA1]